MISTNKSLGSRLKARLVHIRIRQLTKRDWCARHQNVYDLNPTYRHPCQRSVEQQHRALWRALRPQFSLDTLRVCHGISGLSDPRIVPEEVYVSEIEPCLNQHSEANFLANKNVYNRWYKIGIFPEVYVHNIEGDFYDGQYRQLNPAALHQLLDAVPYPVVLKPSVGPGGGAGVSFPQNLQTLKEQMHGRQNFVVQQRILQHEFLNRYNNTGLNTFRVCTYRSVIVSQIHILNISMRMGKGGSLDNETAGGIVCGIHSDGRLNSYAVDKYGTKFLKHPDSGMDFSRQEFIPQFDILKQLVRTVAQDVYLTRLVSLDACLDEHGQWRLIEMNLFNQTIRFSQYIGRPFFGEFTNEVIEFCRNHPTWR